MGNFRKQDGNDGTGNRVDSSNRQGKRAACWVKMAFRTADRNSGVGIGTIQ